MTQKNEKVTKISLEKMNKEKTWVRGGCRDAPWRVSTVPSTTSSPCRPWPSSGGRSRARGCRSRSGEFGRSTFLRGRWRVRNGTPWRTACPAPGLSPRSPSWSSAPRRRPCWRRCGSGAPLSRAWRNRSGRAVTSAGSRPAARPYGMRYPSDCH